MLRTFQTVSTAWVSPCVVAAGSILSSCKYSKRNDPALLILDHCLYAWGRRVSWCPSLLSVA